MILKGEIGYIDICMATNSLHLGVTATCFRNCSLPFSRRMSDINVSSLPPFEIRKRPTFIRSSAFGKVNTSNDTKTAEESINEGLQLYKKGKINEALKRFNRALELNLSEEESQAALYNKACCHAFREESKEAQSALREALGKYGLRFSVILSDPDMAPFRATPEFTELQNEARMGGQEIGSGFRRDLKLLSEVRSPFRGVRKFLYVGLGMAAGISTLFTVPQVIKALQGGDNAPEVTATLVNLAINVGGGAILAALFLWERRKEEEQMARLQRDESLSRLPVRLSTSRVVELSQLRDSTRPVIVAGKRASVERSLKQAERYRSALSDRGVLLIPLIYESAVQSQQKGLVSTPLTPKKGFGEVEQKKEAAGTAPQQQEEADLTADEFEERAKELAAKRVGQLERKFKAEVVSPGEWVQWLRQQQLAEGVKPGEDVYIVLRLDGRIRKSGTGSPDWGQIVEDVPSLDNIVSKLER